MNNDTVTDMQSLFNLSELRNAITSFSEKLISIEDRLSNIELILNERK